MSLPTLVRPNGKRYRPRAIAVEPWLEDDAGRPWRAGAFVFGTHDVETARYLATEAIIAEFGEQYQAGKPAQVWLRRGYGPDGQMWVHDEARGRACVVFEAEEW